MAPLTKRLPREFAANLGKYIGIFLLMCITVALTSGFLLAAHSISEIIDRIPADYHTEDGELTTSFEATDAQLDAAAKKADSLGGVTFYKDWSVDVNFKKSANDTDRARTLETYPHRTEVNVAAYAEGEVPAAADEVAVDRVFAKNNEVSTGDTILLAGKEFKVVGIMTLPDHQALFQNNSDFTVNTLTFGVAEVSDEGFSALQDAGAQLNYTYAFVFGDADATLAERLDVESDMMKALSEADATVDDLLDKDSNQGFVYAQEDTEGDSTMWLTLLYIIIAIMAFIFVVLTNATIEEESAIIGTLLASGYRRSELVLHYMIVPTLVGVMACFVGTALGLTIFTEPMKNLYYGSYSLPPFQVYWDWNIFAQTALVPLVVLVLITFLGLLRKIGHTPLEFLRHETSKSRIKHGFNLPEKMGFVGRFRLRIFLRNIGNFATLFVGIYFASVLLLFGLAVLPTMQHYADNLHNTVVAEHEYTLKAPLELEGTDAQRTAWKNIDELQSVDASKLTDVEDAGEELQDAADDAQAAVDKLTEAAATLQASPTAENMQAAQDAQTAVQDAADKAQKLQDAFNEKLDSLASDLGKSRDDVQEMLESIEDVDLDDDNVHPVNTVDNGSSKITQAEKYAVYSLEYDRGGDAGTENITVYGVQEDSRYWKGLNVGNGAVVLGNGLTDKFGFKEGDSISLYDKYEDKTYSVTYKGDGCSWGTKSDMAMYMSLEDFNEFFGNDEDYFCAYASDEALQLDGRYLSTDLTPSDMDAIGDQFVSMMNDMIGMLVGLAVAIFLIFMYLLTKSIIDRNARSISYMKVFGYRDGEISKLYVRSITWCVLISLVLCQPLIIWSLTGIFRLMLMSYNGNIEIYVPMIAIAECIITGALTYAVVALIHVHNIKKVPLSLALKVQE